MIVLVGLLFVLSVINSAALFVLYREGKTKQQRGSIFIDCNVVYYTRQDDEDWPFEKREDHGEHARAF